MRVLITGGGTAGHVNPALAIAEIIREREPNSIIEYVGCENGIEGKLVAKKGMTLHPIQVRGLARSLSPSNIKAVKMALSAKKTCKKLILDFKPDLVIGTGGYVCWPLIAAASSMKIPSVLHESNAQPGFAVKLLRNKADLILVNFESTKQHLQKVKAKIVRVGMPVNKAFTRPSSRIRHISQQDGASNQASQTRKILSFGGSLGAYTMNEAALVLMRDFISKHPEVTLEHATGERDYERVKALFDKEGLGSFDNIKLSPYIYDMPHKMSCADLVICRSGASTLAELGVAKKAAILIPSPNVTGDQQRKNANQLLEKEAAIVIEDDKAVESIVQTVAELLKDDEALQKLSQNVSAFAFRDCDDRIYKELRDLLDKG